MKYATKLILLTIPFILETLAARANAAESPGSPLASKPGSFTYIIGEAIEFQPFDLGDFVNPLTGKAYLPHEPVTLHLQGRVRTYSSALEFVQAINDTEKALNRIGKSLREGDIKINARTIANPNLILGQISALMDIAPDKLWQKAKNVLEKCDLLKVEELSADASVTNSSLGKKEVNLNDYKPMALDAFVAKVNQQQKFLCRLGYSYVDKTLAGSENFVKSMLEKRQEILDNLGISQQHPVFDFTYLKNLDDVEKLADEVRRTVKELNNPTPSHLYDLARRVTAPLPPALQLPEIPTIPSQVVKKRPGLSLKKRKTWNGINAGNDSELSFKANAWIEVNGTDTKEEVRSQALANIHIIKKEISILEGNGYLYAGQDGVEGHLSASILGIDLYTHDIKKQLQYSWGNDKELACEITSQPSTNDHCPFRVPFPTEYTQPFAIGPIPGYVTVGIKGTLGYGWNAGLTLLSAQGAIKPYADLSAYGIGALGFKDIIAAGLEGDVLLVRDTIVVQGNAGVKFDDNGIPKLELGIVGEHSYTVMAGRIFAFVKADALKAVESLFPGAVELVKSAAELGQKIGEGIEHAGNVIEGGIEHTGNVISNAVGNLHIKGWKNSPLYLASSNGTIGYFNLDSLEKALTYYHEWDIWNSGGWSEDNARFLNYHVTISPFGTTFYGDSVDHTDREEAQHLADVLSVAEEENAIDKLKFDVSQKEAAAFRAINQDLNSTIALTAASAPADLTSTMNALDGDRDAYLEKLNSWVNL